MESTAAPASTALLSIESEAVVKATAGVVAEHAEQITARFYPSMFAAHPELLRVFNQGNQATGEQSRALAASVVAYAVQLIDPAAPSFDHVMRRIAHKHVSLGIRPEQYTIVGHHLMGAVAAVLGDAVTPAVADCLGRGVLALRHPADRRRGPAVPAGRGRPGAADPALPGGQAHRRGPRRGLPGAGARRRGPAARRSSRDSTSRSSSTCPTETASPASTRSRPPRPAPGCRSPSAGCVARVGRPDGRVSTHLHDRTAGR